MKSYTSTSTVRPEEWDKDSSVQKVYHNFNVVEIPATEESPLMYHYDVDEYERQEYIQKVANDSLAALGTSDVAMVELAAMLDNALTCIDEQNAALVELAGLIGGVE